MSEYVGCTIKQLPAHMLEEAAALACEYNPANRPPAFRVRQFGEALMELLGLPADQAPAGAQRLVTMIPGHLAVMNTKYWGPAGKVLTVGFPFQTVTRVLAEKILGRMNAWYDAGANIRFVLTNTDPQVRISLEGDGYWSYLGTDILSVPRNEPTMTLDGFTLNTPDSEYDRVVTHEAGHSCGFVHEHLRAELVARIDRAKAIAYFQQTQGWTPTVTTQQVLTPLANNSVMGTPHADQDSIMCYQLPGSITTDGQPIRGGAKINAMDIAFATKLYPRETTTPVQPPPVTPPTGPDLSPFRVTIEGTPLSLIVDPAARTVKLV